MSSVRTSVRTPLQSAALTSTPYIPRPALLGAGALLAFVLVVVMIAGPMKHDAPVPSLAIAQSPGVPLLRDLRFTDGADSSVQVIDGRSGQLIEAVQGEQGFLRGVLRGLAQERLRRGIGDGPVFQLMASADGRLTLSDPATGRSVDLESFGRDNAAVFARWLQPAGAAPSPTSR